MLAALRARGWRRSDWWGLSRGEQAEILAYEDKLERERKEKVDRLLESARQSKTLTGWLAQLIILANA